MSVVYLIHFDTPYKQAKHYLGYTSNLTQRLEAHQSGHGSRLMEVITEAGISWTLARKWSNGTRRLERQLKKRKNSPKLCPICNGEKCNSE